MNSNGEGQISTLLDQAIEHHVAGRLDQAGSVYHQILEIDPYHPIALNQLGTIALQTGDFDAAVTLITLATNHKPDYAEAYNNLASALLKLDRTEDALASYRKAIDVKPDYINAYNNLADALISQGQPEQAVECYNKALAINYDYFQGHNNLGNALMILGQPKQAIASYHEAIAIKPDYFEAHNNLGNAMAELAMPNEAIASYQMALKIKPDYAEAVLNLGTVFMKTGKNNQAIVCFQKVLSLKPDYAEAYFSLGKASNNESRLEDALNFYIKALANKPLYPAALNNMGNVLLELRRSDEAVAVLTKALKIKPDYVEAHSNLGNALKEQNLAEDAIASYRQAISLNPNFAEAHCNLGVLFKELGDLDKAMSCFSKALEVRPNYATAKLNLGLAFLLKGELEKGWKGYANRWKCRPLGKTQRTYNAPPWEGQDITDKTLFLYPEQGLGDFIQFVRYLPLIREHGGRVITEAPEALYELISGSFEDFQITETGKTPSQFDFHAPMLDLPILLGTTEHSIPAPEAYLNTPVELAQKWRKRLDAYDGFKVGLVWAGDPEHKNDKNRSIDPSHLAPLLQLDGIKTFSLQVGHDGEANKVLGEAILDLAPELTSFSETAAVVKNLDVVISIDSSPAHLAGALGCRVWTLLPFMPDWRWLLDGDTTLWYPSMRLFRQAIIGSWSCVIEDVCQALRATGRSD
jgi:tetratricopeptide (TPR) repeat protein